MDGHDANEGVGPQNTGERQFGAPDIQTASGHHARYDQMEVICASQAHENDDGKRNGDEVAEVSKLPHHHLILVIVEMGSD